MSALAALLNGPVHGAPHSSMYCCACGTITLLIVPQVIEVLNRLYDREVTSLAKLDHPHVIGCVLFF